jgi:hypothetical protein
LDWDGSEVGCVRVGYGDGLGWNGVRWNGIGVKWGWVEMGWCGIGMGRVRMKIGLSEVVRGSGGLGWAWVKAGWRCDGLICSKGVVGRMLGELGWGWHGIGCDDVEVGWVEIGLLWV